MNISIEEGGSAQATYQGTSCDESSQATGASLDESPATQSCKVVILGGASVGKTSLLHKFLSHDHVYCQEADLGKNIFNITQIYKYFTVQTI